MSKFYALKVKDVKRETEECVSIGIDVPSHLSKEFDYLHGQYLTLKFTLQGEELRRSYSICSSPLENNLRIAVKKVQAGRVSTYINEQLKAGDTIECMSPYGHFNTELNKYNKKTYCCFVAGSGITPVLSILTTVLGAEPLSTVWLFYGNSSEDRVIFKNELTLLQSKYSGRLHVHYLYTKPVQSIEPLFLGRMTEAKIASLLEAFPAVKASNDFFICGPGDMMNHAKAGLEALSIAKTSIHVEYFTPPPADTVKVKEVDSNDATAQLTIVLDGEERTVVLKKGQTVLEAALDIPLDAPYACQSGSCCTCRAKLIEGKVHMDVNYSLLDSEVAAGYILTCQSHALTPTIKVDYDKAN